MNNDPEYQSYRLARVEPHMDADKPHFILVTEDSGCLCVANPERLPLPKPGDVARFYGRGFGYPVRGVVVGDIVYRYQTAEEERETHARQVAERKAEKRRTWDANTEANAARVAAMPEAFSKRIEFFMRSPEWGPEFGPYELFVCEEAIKIAAACEVSDIDALRKDFDRQRAIGLDVDNHSGNTFGAACMLASLYLSHPDDVYRAHGAMCPLTGCAGYGCWASTQAPRG